MTNVKSEPVSGAIHLGYKTGRGRAYCCKAEDFFASPLVKKYKGKIQLIFTSPPFPLNTKKAYGNLVGEEYTLWLARFAPLFKQMLTPTGSIVLEMGNAWEPGQPVMSTLALEGLLEFLRHGNLKLAQQFICYRQHIPFNCYQFSFVESSLKSLMIFVHCLKDCDCRF
jgi:hypothetical protein